MHSDSINILFFARLREELNTHQLTITGSETTPAAILQQLIAEHPQWQATLERAPVLCAINHTIAALDHPVGPGDEVGFFPMVTGG